MQLFAKDRFGQIIASPNALKQTDYTCLECGGAVRVRQGTLRKAHFYHISPSKNCRQSGKGAVHLQVQLRLEQMLSDIRLEVSFPKVKRIADVVWEAEKIIFEVQCSPITAEEVLNRNDDYAEVGYQVVWILHDRRYNQFAPKEAEVALTDFPHYFTNIDENGKGIFYDKVDRLIGTSPLQFHHPVRIEPNSNFRFWPLRFKGDLTEYLPEKERPAFAEMLKNGYSSLLHSLLKTYAQ